MRGTRAALPWFKKRARFFNLAATTYNKQQCLRILRAHSKPESDTIRRRHNMSGKEIWHTVLRAFYRYLSNNFFVCYQNSTLDVTGHGIWIGSSITRQYITTFWQLTAEFQLGLSGNPFMPMSHKRAASSLERSSTMPFLEAASLLATHHYIVIRHTTIRRTQKSYRLQFQGSSLRKPWKHGKKPIAWTIQASQRCTH